MPFKFILSFTLKFSASLNVLEIKFKQPLSRFYFTRYFRLQKRITKSKANIENKI